MSLTSRQNVDFDIRLLEVEELYRQRKPEIARERLQALDRSGYSPDGFELGLLKYLKSADLYYAGKYHDSIDMGREAGKLLVSSALHLWVGNLYLTLYRDYIALGDLKKADRYVNDALAFYRQADDSVGMVGALNGLARLAFIRSDFDKAVDYIQQALELSQGDNIRMSEEISNLGRIEILKGDWALAEEHLQTALKLAAKLDLTISLARNHLSLGYLYLRKREFPSSAREFKSASMIIDENKFQREKVIQLEYEGELAYEQGDIVRAKSILNKAYGLGRKLAPESSLISQIVRRLAQIELGLDNFEEAQRLAQKGLDLSIKIGERSEIGLCRIIVAEVFAANENFESAIEYLNDGLDELRESGDPYDVARSLLVLADIYMKMPEDNFNRVDKALDEAFRLFAKLKLYYWAGETRLRFGMYCCQTARISAGFKNLLKSESIFQKISEKAKIRRIQNFKIELSKQAVDTSLSPENEFKIFGNYFTDSEYLNLKSGHIQEIIDILGKRTRSSRVVVYKKDEVSPGIVTSLSLTQIQQKKFIRQFQELLGEEFNSKKPTLILDSRRDPFVNELLHTTTKDVISSVIVVPLILGQETTGYIYLDRISTNGNYLPFGQRELNFAVGFADLLSLKLAEYDKLLLEEDNKRLKAQLLEESAFANIVTRNKQMLEMLSRVQQVVNSDISISIQGETGSGKDLLAKAIHYSSSRKEKRFISVNCAALPETLLESELFGHKKGAFTGADKDKVGLFEEANGGTFFLDEVADMPLSIQAKVLRILEEKEIVRLGDTRPQKVDVRIISATNKDLKTEMEAGKFRQDLYYRLTALCFTLPPLRERREDIPLLLRHFSDDNIKFTADAVKYLVAFDWPGNVRELENEVKKLTLLSGDKGVIDAELLSAKILDAAGAANPGDLDINTDIDFNVDFSLYDYLAEYEKRFIIKALRDHSGVKKHAARQLNIPESTLRLKIKQYNIDIKGLNAA
jgi:two-component system, NtrC family, response regulator PilR